MSRRPSDSLHSRNLCEYRCDRVPDSPSTAPEEREIHPNDRRYGEQEQRRQPVGELQLPGDQSPEKYVPQRLHWRPKSPLVKTSKEAVRFAPIMIPRGRHHGTKGTVIRFPPQRESCDCPRVISSCDTDSYFVKIKGGAAVESKRAGNPSGVHVGLDQPALRVVVYEIYS